jgi:predicted regulator of Ras-like GTPase activity (Roadblock/LC7/MglB family)
LAATLAQYAGRLGEGAGCGELGTAVLDFAQGLVVLARAGSEDWLAILVRPGADIGPLLYDLRQHRPALAGLL